MSTCPDGTSVQIFTDEYEVDAGCIDCPFRGLSGKLRLQTQMLHSVQAPVNLSTHITANIITRAILQSIASIQIRYHKPAQEDISIDKQLRSVASCVASSCLLSSIPNHIRRIAKRTSRTAYISAPRR